jgi:hypothetical protein
MYIPPRAPAPPPRELRKRVSAHPRAVCTPTKEPGDRSGESAQRSRSARTARGASFCLVMCEVPHRLARGHRTSSDLLAARWGATS